jgi:hypothetical protein
MAWASASWLGSCAFENCPVAACCHAPASLFFPNPPPSPWERLTQSETVDGRSSNVAAHTPQTWTATSARTSNMTPYAPRDISYSVLSCITS